MISHEPPLLRQRPTYSPSRFSPPKPPVAEDTLQSCEVTIERKTFVLALKENPRGRFLRITELRNPRSAAIIIPAPGLPDFQKLLAAMVQADAEILPKPSVAPPLA